MKVSAGGGGGGVEGGGSKTRVRQVCVGGVGPPRILRKEWLDRKGREG